MQNRLYINQNPGLLLKFLYNNILGRIILKILILPIWTKISGKFMDSKYSTFLIKPFIKNNNINLDLYEDKDYLSFNDFFTRKLKDEHYQVNNDSSCLISPCDGKLTVYPITEDGVFKIKHSHYSVASLLNNPKLAEEYKDGYCLIFRLSTDDYHRYSYIDDGKHSKNNVIPGIFHTVQPIALKHYPIYITNHRSYTVLETQNFDKVIQLEIGALMVGKINNYHKRYTFKRGDYKGEFKFGASSIILLLKKDQVKINKDIIHNTNYNYETIVKIGTVIGKKNN